MAKSLEVLAKEIYNEALADGEEITMEEAEEMAKMEIGAKDIKHEASAKDTPKKERKPREKKIDEEKKKIIEIIHQCLTDNGFNATIVNVDKSIDFECFTVNLVRHRKKK